MSKNQGVNRIKLSPLDYMSDKQKKETTARALRSNKAHQDENTVQKILNKFSVLKKKFLQNSELIIIIFIKAKIYCCNN